MFATHVPETLRPRLEVDLSAVRRNWQYLQSIAAPGAECGAVLKADGYGLGAKSIARSLIRVGCRTLFVAQPEEGLALSELCGDSTRVVVLSGFDRSTISDLRDAGIVPVLSTPEQIERWSTENRSSGHALPCFIQVETGMHRLGLSMDAYRALLYNNSAFRSVFPISIMSHLSSATDPLSIENKKQLRRFQACAQLARAAAPNSQFSLANSAGIFLGAKYHFSLLRPGIALFGHSQNQRAKLSLKPCATLHASILQIATVAEGDTIGYDAAFRAHRSMRIATVSIGYADGLCATDNKLAGALICGHPAPIVGKISMDLTTLDVSCIPPSALNRAKYATFLGETISVRQFAEASGCNAYEVFTRLGNRVRRIYHQ